MFIEKVESSIENWWQARAKLDNGAIAIGYGTTPDRAIVNCYDDVSRIELFLNRRKLYGSNSN